MHRLCLIARPSVTTPARLLLPSPFCFAHAHLSTSPFAAKPVEAGDDSPGRSGSGNDDGSRGGDGVTPAPSPTSSPPPPPAASSPLDDPLAFLDDLGIGGPGGGDGAGGSRTRPPPPPPGAPSVGASTFAADSWPAVGGSSHRRWDSPGDGGVGGGGYGRGGDAEVPDDPMFSQSATAGILDGEVRRMAAVYRLVKEHAAAASGTGPPVNTETNTLLDPRLSPIRSLPRVAPAVLAELRHQLPAEDAAAVHVSSSAPSTPAAGTGATAAPHDGRAAAEAALWRRVDASTMDPNSFARLVRASALAPGAAAAGRDVGGAAGAAGAPGTAAGAPGGMGGAGMPGYRGGGGRSKAASKAAARVACPLSDARGRVEVDYRQVELLRGFVNSSGRILSRRVVGTTAKAQRRVSRAIKTARQMALLNPTAQVPIEYSEDRGGAGGYTGL